MRLREDLAEVRHPLADVAALQLRNALLRLHRRPAFSGDFCCLAPAICGAELLIELRVEVGAPSPRSAAAAWLAAGARRAACPRRRSAARLPRSSLHLGPGVPVVRALGADHPVSLRVKEVGLVQELQDVAQRGPCCAAGCSRWGPCG